MSLMLKLSCLALRPVLGGAAKLILQGIEFKAAEEAVCAVESYVVACFNDPSKNLRNALARAADRSWRAVEIALSGESFWSRLTDRGEELLSKARATHLEGVRERFLRHFEPAELEQMATWWNRVMPGAGDVSDLSRRD